MIDIFFNLNQPHPNPFWNFWKFHRSVSLPTIVLYQIDQSRRTTSTEKESKKKSCSLNMLALPPTYSRSYKLSNKKNFTKIDHLGKKLWWIEDHISSTNWIAWVFGGFFLLFQDSNIPVCDVYIDKNITL